MDDAKINVSAGNDSAEVSAAASGDADVNLDDLLGDAIIVDAKVEESSADVTAEATAEGGDVKLDVGSVLITGQTGDYKNLTNKPSVNGVTLEGNKSLKDLGDDSLSTEDIRNSVDKAFQIVFGR